MQASEQNAFYSVSLVENGILSRSWYLQIKVFFTSSSNAIDQLIYLQKKTTYKELWVFLGADLASNLLDEAFPSQYVNELQLKAWFMAIWILESILVKSVGQSFSGPLPSKCNIEAGFDQNFTNETIATEIDRS